MRRELRQFAASRDAVPFSLTVPDTEAWVVYRATAALQGSADIGYDWILTTADGFLLVRRVVDDGSHSLVADAGSMVLNPGDVLALGNDPLLDTQVASADVLVSGVAYSLS